MQFPKFQMREEEEADVIFREGWIILFTTEGFFHRYVHRRKEKIYVLYEPLNCIRFFFLFRSKRVNFFGLMFSFNLHH